LPVRFDNVHLNGLGLYLPGPPIGNDAMDDYVAPLNRASARIKQRILTENGIQTRHYAIDPDGRTRESHASLAANAIRACLAIVARHAGRCVLLAVGSSGGDALMPGFANMIQGELAAPPMQTLSSQGVCVAGVSALEFAAQAVALGSHAHALAVGADMPSRMFKHTRFAPAGYRTDFDAHFPALDAVGRRRRLSAGSHAAADWGQRARAQTQVAASEELFGRLPGVHAAGPDARPQPLFPRLRLVQRGRSRRRAGAAAGHSPAAARVRRWHSRIREAGARRLDRAGAHRPLSLPLLVGQVHPGHPRHAATRRSLAIDDDKWWNNLATRGNTGAASIFVMLAEWFTSVQPKAGETVLCFVPESGRMTAAFMAFEVVDCKQNMPLPPTQQARAAINTEANDTIAPAAVAEPHAPADAPAALRPVLTALAGVWQDYRSGVWRTPIVQQLVHGRFDVAAYRRWTQHGYHRCARAAAGCAKPWPSSMPAFCRWPR
jgi:3-oxoacyl-[acyl-carrier-protein] synthase-3